MFDILISGECERERVLLFGEWGRKRGERGGNGREEGRTQKGRSKIRRRGGGGRESLE